LALAKVGEERNGNFGDEVIDEGEGLGGAAAGGEIAHLNEAADGVISFEGGDALGGGG
jgi:hypothetical protein